MRLVAVGALLVTVGLTFYVATPPALGEELETALEYEARGVYVSVGVVENVPEAVARLRDHNLNLVLMDYQGDQTKAMNEFAQACHENGIEVQLLVRPHAPEELLIHGYDHRRKQWVKQQRGFFLPEYRQAAAQRAAKLMRELPVDGICLDGFRYGLPWDNLGPEAAAQFAKDMGLDIEDYRTDIIIVDNITSDNIGNPREWAGKYISKWTAWRCRVLADLFGEISRAVRAVDPKLAVSNSVMVDTESALYYGVDYGLLAPHLDFFAPMVYYNAYRGDAKWAIRRCREIAIEAQAANPNCCVYPFLPAFSEVFCRIAIRDTVDEAQKAERLTSEQIAQNHLLQYHTGSEMLHSATWLYAHDIIDAPIYNQMLHHIITDEEIVQAIELRRAGRERILPDTIKNIGGAYIDDAPVEGIVFFRYLCMFPDSDQGVVGNLWDKLKLVFPKPAALPHRRVAQ